MLNCRYDSLEEDTVHSRWIVTACLLVMVLALALVPFMVRAEPLKADFEAHPPTSGIAPFTARFFDHSAAEFSRLWNFGDGGTSTLPDPEHTYANPGSYTVSLTAYDQTGTISDTKTIPNCIVVSSEGGGFPYPSPTPGITDTYPTVTATTVPSTTATPALTGTIEVISVPAGAMFSLDGVEQGITPITVYTVQVGKHSVKVNTKGYVDNQTSVTVENQKTVQLKIVLTASSAKPSSSPTPTQSPVATMTATPTAEAQKAAVYQTPTTPEKKGTGSVIFFCDDCKPSDWIGNGYVVLPYTKGMIFENVPAGGITITVYYSDYGGSPDMSTYHSQYQINLHPGETITVHGQRHFAPGFTTLLVVLAIAGIIGFRRLLR